MSVVTGNIKDIGGVPTRASELRIHAREYRAEYGGLLTTEVRRVPIESDGSVRFSAVGGPAVMHLVGVGGGISDAIPVLISGDRDMSLEECVKAAGDADEYSKRELEQMVLEVREYYPRFGEVAKSAWEAASEAGSSASSAASSARDAGESAGAAGEAESAAAESARGASTAESNAQEHASTAAKHEVAAMGHAEDAEGSAESAREDADRAATIAGSTRWVGTQVEVNGERSPDLMPVLTISPQGTWVVNGVDTGQPARGPGGASNWEDISGKPAVFPPSSHSHTSSQVTDAVNDAGDPRFGGKLLKGRNSDGKIFYYQEPTEGRELSNKSYVDRVVGGAASVTALSALEVQVNLRPAFFSGPGKPPASVPGARVGDYWLDETTMELHKITEV